MKKFGEKSIKVFILLATVGAMIVGCGQNRVVQENDPQPSMTEEEDQEEEKGEEAPKLPVFYAADFTATDIPREFSIENYYITYKGVNDGCFYRIDENHVLWARGENSYGQLGIGRAGDLGDIDAVYEEELPVAEQVVSVDSCYGTMLYLTEGGELYGVGENWGGMLLEPMNNSADEYDDARKNVVVEAKLLMSDVAYARIAYDMISVLKTNGDVYAWSTRNPEPTLMVQNAIYTTVADYRGAAITKDHELYMWGDNTDGVCAADISQAYLESAQKVQEDVRMVWCDVIGFNTVEHKPMKVEGEEGTICYSQPRYDNTFILKEDGQFYACGKALPGKQYTSGPLAAEQLEDEEDANMGYSIVQYSSAFQPVDIQQEIWVEYEGE